MPEFLHVIAHIANGSYAAGYVQNSVPSLGMSMHVEQAGHERLARSVDDLGVFGNIDRRRWANHRNPLALDHNRLVFPDGGLLGIEQAHMLHRNWMFRVTGQFMSQTCVAFVASFAVEGIELIVRILPAFSKKRE